MMVVGCGPEQCDDGNATVGDGCTAACTLERAPGGGSPTTDCQVEWVFDNPANDPLLDKNGRFRVTQTCRDDDPRCDADGGTPGGCTFRVRTCGNATDLDGCQPPNRLASWVLQQPSVSQAAKRPPLAAVRAAFAGVPALLVGPTERDRCTDWLALRVPLRGGTAPGKLGIKTTSLSYDGSRDVDKVKLVCLPASP